MLRPHVLTPERVDVWVVGLDAPESAPLASCLTAEELARSRRFRFDSDRERFVRGRGAARTILSQYVSQAPADLLIDESPLGKPALAIGPLAFNISHSGPVFVLAVHASGPVGIDVEVPKPIADLDSLASTVLSERELRQFERIPPDRRLASFYHAWTLKEAVLKYLGHGFSTPPTSVHIDFEAGPTPTLRHVDATGWVPDRVMALSPVSLPKVAGSSLDPICSCVVPATTAEVRTNMWPSSCSEAEPIAKR